ncbi:MAG TPA: amidohydrolase [Phototrophicaceae bacterium]|nr:amidohydrolase [Phototrophicaceae bacterium]
MTYTFINRILYNGKIRTLDDARPMVSALAISGERVVAYGRDEEMRALAGAGTVQENLGGRFVVPGMTDAHLHWQMETQALQNVQLYNLPSKEAALERVTAKIKTAAPGEWIVGYGWLQDEWAGQNGQFPTRHDLDAIAPDNPVFLVSRSAHAGWTNSLALKLSGVDRNTRDPESGTILHDEAGDPSGILLEPMTMNLVRSHIPVPTVDQLATQMKATQTLALSLGITGFHDFDDQECFSALQIMRERGDLALRVVKNFNKKYLDAVLTVGLRRWFGDDWIRLGGLKIFADGAIGPRTAAMFEPYDGEPNNYGIVVTDKEEMVEMVSRASAAGFASTIHAIGDKAVHDVLDVYEHVRKEEAQRGEVPATRRHRIEHVQIIHPSDVDRLAQLNVIASMQPIHATSDYPVADRYWGKRTPYSYNPRLQLDRGVVVAFGSDTPVEPMGSLIGIHAAVTRQRADGSPGPDGWNPAARLTVDEALRGYTLGPAYAAGMENRLGRLAPGFLADLVVLDRDLYSIAPADILTTQIVSTMVGGLWRWGEFAR